MVCEVHVRAGRVHLEGELNIYAAPQLKETLVAALRANLGNPVLDLSNVSEIDTAGLQMLVVARRLSIAGGTQLKIVNPSAPAREVLELCGLDKLIETEAPEQKKTRKRARSPS
jgi:anti-sigma B factor antagonist